MVFRKLLLIVFLLSSIFSFAQKQDGGYYRYYVQNGDTIVIVDLPVVVINNRNKRKPLTKQQIKRYDRLTLYVKKVYPYAKLAGTKLKEYEGELLAAKDDKQRRKIMKNVEKALKEKYGEELKKLTITQGKILLKLIDRETGKTSYELVKELRGKTSATMWQGLALLFGQNLKSDYNPQEDDWMIEDIVQKIERGEL